MTERIAIIVLWCIISLLRPEGVDEKNGVLSTWQLRATAVHGAGAAARFACLGLAVILLLVGGKCEVDFRAEDRCFCALKTSTKVFFLSTPCPIFNLYFCVEPALFLCLCV